MSKFLSEYMIRAETESRVCRMWRQCGPSYEMSNDELKSFAVEIMNRHNSLVVLASLLVAIDGNNSVEIIERSSGDGICIHKDWP